MWPLILIAAAAYLYFQRPDIISQIAGGANWDVHGLTSGNTPFAQSLLSETIAPMGSKLNPRLMTHTTFAVALPEGTTQAEADAIVNNRLPSRNLPLAMHQFTGGTLWLTSKTNDAGELAAFEDYLHSVPGAVVTKTNTQIVKYYLIANNWVSELILDQWLEDCPRQKMLNPGAFGDEECPTNW